MHLQCWSRAASVQCGGEDVRIKATFKFSMGASGWVTEGEALNPTRSTASPVSRAGWKDLTGRLGG